MPSPCIGDCRAVGGICLGCGRTLGEIGHWSAMDEAQQRALIEELKGERSSARCERCGEPLYCAVSAGEGIEACWCNQTRPLPMAPDATRCLCRRCHALAQQQAGR